MDSEVNFADPFKVVYPSKKEKKIYRQRGEFLLL